MLPKSRSSIRNEPPRQLPEGLYNFEIVDVGEIPQMETKFGVRDFLSVYCVVLDRAERGELLTRRITRSYTSGFEGGSSSHLYELACAVTGDILEDTEPFNINDLVGSVFKGKVLHNKDSKGRTWANIVKVKDADAGTEKLSDSEKVNAMEIVKRIEERQDEKSSASSDVFEDTSIPEGTEDVEPEEVSV